MYFGEPFFGTQLIARITLPILDTLYCARCSDVVVDDDLPARLEDGFNAARCTLNGLAKTEQSSGPSPSLRAQDRRSRTHEVVNERDLREFRVCVIGAQL